MKESSLQMILISCIPDNKDIWDVSFSLECDLERVKPKVNILSLESVTKSF